MMMHAVLLVVLCFFSLTSWAQILAPPPTSFPDASSTPPFTTSPTTRPSSSTLTTPRPSGSLSASPSVSGNATQTSSAQFPSLSGYSSCVSQCLAMSVSAANCTTLVEVNCFCPSGLFTSSYVNCLAANCPTDLTSAESLAQQFCKLSNSTSTSLSFPSVPPATTTTTSVLVTSASTTPGSTATGSSGASSSATSIGADAMSIRLALIVTMLGVVLGAYLVD